MSGPDSANQVDRTILRGLCLERGLLKSAMVTLGIAPLPSGVRDSSSLMKPEDEARYVLPLVILQARTFSPSPSFSSPLTGVQ